MFVSLCSALSSTVHGKASRRFWIEDDAFWKDGAPFEIIGGDVHYFRIVPQYWKDRLLRAKALGLNTIQTYVPWNLHEPEPQSWELKGFAHIELYLTLAQELEMLVMLHEGFWYHHAENTNLMLAYWLPNTPHTLPINATHRVSVGAFVMNDKREVLVVQEKNDVLKGLGMWKFPTGVVERVKNSDLDLKRWEDINIGVVREVKEETGVDAKFVEVVAFRPLSVDITKQESEIEDAQWMPVEEFAAQPFVQKYELVKYILEVGLAKVDKEYT
ncbi:Nudix hydrolase 2 [Hordeum vulgare]|nr:Nudix hydrolase 2 [Hordeum vulgare]